MTSLLREETPVPMPEAASATITSCPASAAARADGKPDHARSDHQNLHRFPARQCVLFFRRKRVALKDAE